MTALQQRRVELGLTQIELADRAGLHRTHVSLIERKRCNLSIGNYLLLAGALDIDAAELMARATIGRA